MNTQTITLTPPIDGVQYGISDEAINLNDWYVDDTNAIRQSIISQSDSDYWLRRTDYKKVILSTNPKDLRFPYLVMPSKEQEALIFANTINPKQDEYSHGRWYGRIEGFNANPAKYTQEQMEKAIENAHAAGVMFSSMRTAQKDVEVFKKDYFQSLQSIPKAVRVEMEENQCDGCKGGIPYDNGYHKMGTGKYANMMVCQKDKYNKIKVETSTEYPQGIVVAKKVIY